MKNLLMLSLIFFGITTHAHTIDGHVYDDQGIPVAEVTVWVKGTSNKTKTDQSGYFMIEVEKEEVVLEFFHKDFEYQKKKVRKNETIKIYLIPKALIEEDQEIATEEVFFDKKLFPMVLHSDQWPVQVS